MRARLTPAPGRGDVLAAGAVVLTTFAVLLDARVAHRWDAGWRFALFAVLALLVGELATQAPRQQDAPLPYHSTLQVAGIVLGGLALINLADLLGSKAQLGGSGETLWTSIVLGIGALAWARRTNSAIMTLFAAALGVVAVLSFVDWVAHPHGTQTFRWFLLLCALALTLGAVWLRDRARRHAVALADVAGLSIIVLGLTLAIGRLFIFPDQGDIVRQPPQPLGWALVLLAFGFGLIAYGTVDRERVPPFLGVLCLILFVVVVGIGATSFVGWPLVLLIIAVALLVIGLRPRQELPPEPPVHQ